MNRYFIDLFLKLLSSSIVFVEQRIMNCMRYDDCKYNVFLLNEDAREDGFYVATLLHIVTIVYGPSPRPR